ncbi:MAG TPA: nucleoside hydrolase, partial [Candidatus Rokubacteria bacterium]|nr:nucleoside hydrolase [Candidatus Rokubacteria bacterium]
MIDTDPGIDDALALLLAWGSRELSVEAITTVAGNVPVEVATTNVFRLLALRRPA